MLPHPEDTIVALSSASGPGARAIIRLSGPQALRIALSVFASDSAPRPDQRRLYAGRVRLPDVAAPLPADLYVWPAPRTYTGQHLIELHIISSAPLVESLVAQLLSAGARAAHPGEVTMRALLAGKL